MRNTLRDGGSAFPQVLATGLARSDGDGMSLRDYFAASALHAWIANDAVKRIVESYGISIEDSLPKLAKGCYDIADEMLKARER